MACCILMLMVIVEASSFRFVSTTANDGYEEKGSVRDMPLEAQVIPPLGFSFPSPPPPPYNFPVVMGELEKGPVPPSGPSHCGNSDPCQPPPPSLT